MAKEQTWDQWLRVCSRDPSSPALLPERPLAMLTGQDFRALAAVAAAWKLYANSDADGQAAALVAVRALLLGMQPKCRFLARELIAFAMNWDDRDRLWPRVYGAELELLHGGCGR